MKKQITHHIKGRLIKLSLIAAVLTLAITPIMTVAHASPVDWDWQDASSSAWSDTANNSGPMIWGENLDTVAYGGAIWAGGQSSEDTATLWRYDETTGNWTDELPAGLAAENHTSINALAVYNEKLYLSTDGSSNGNYSSMWVKSNPTASWTKLSSFDTAQLGLTYSMIAFDNSLYIAGADNDGLKVWRFDGTTWTNTNLNNVAYDSWKSSKLTVVGSKLYIDGRTSGDYYGIWEYSGSSWNRIETPFTDEEEDSENHETWHYVKGLGSFDGKLIAVSKDYDHEIMHVWQRTGTTWSQIGLDNFNGDTNDNYNHVDITTFEGNLLIGTGGYMGSARVWQYDASSNEFEQANSDYFGLNPENNQFVPNYVTNFTSSNGVLFVSTSGSGEGDYFPQMWRSQPLGENNNSGGNEEEVNTLPNGGDLNNDGFVDSEQNHVSSFKSPVSEKYVVLEVSDECTIGSAGMKRISELAGRDSGYEYVNGLMDFDVSCGDPGFTATVSQYYYDVSKTNLVLRKYMPTTNAFFTITNASTESTTIAGHVVTKATYQVTDGGELDVDGEVNGVIVDPAGLANNVVGVPRTGLGGKQTN